jgi:KUP system potassium uptake protein
MRSNVKHNHVLHERVVIVVIETVPVPVVRPEELAVVDDLGYTDDGIAHVTISVGYMQQADVPSVLAAIPDESFESPIDFENASYFLSTIDIEIERGDGDQRTAKRASGMPRWRRRLFVAIAGLTADAAEYFNLPRGRTVIIGSRIPL